MRQKRTLGNVHSRQYSDLSPFQGRSRRRPRVFRTLLTGVLLVVLIGVVALGGYLLAGYLKMTRGAAPDATPTPVSSVTSAVSPGVTPEPTFIDQAGLERDLRVPIDVVAQKDPDVQNILLIGVDRRNTASTKGNSDTMMIISIDRKNQTMKMMSILRDCYVTIQKDGKTVKGKINAAYSYGGPGLTINTLNRTFDLDIQKYVLVDFKSAEAVVTAAGGLDIDVSLSEMKNMNLSILETNQVILPDTPASPTLTTAGLQHLDARQTISYARIRKVDLVVNGKTIPMDFGRVERQKIVLRGLMTKFFDADVLRKLDMTNQVFNMVETNLRLSDALGLMQFASTQLKKDASSIQGYTIPVSKYYTVIETPVWCFVVDFNKAIPDIQQYIWGKTFEFTPRDPVTP